MNPRQGSLFCSIVDLIIAAEHESAVSNIKI